MSNNGAMRLTRVLLIAVLAAGCGGGTSESSWVVPDYPAPTFTRQPVTGHGTAASALPSPKPSVAPSPRRSPQRASRARTSSGSAAWASSWAARRVAECESGGNPRAVNPSGKYRGKWQMDRSFWRTYGGLRFASRPDLATEAQQDEVAYRGWLARGWQPWSCRSVL